VDICQESTTTPMMQQYLDLKRQHQDEVLFFRLGDFYEMFMDDAREVSRLLNLTLTARNGVPMCGIPHHAAKNYLRRLLDAGKKVAICEQVELPQAGKNLAKREIVQIVTPGTVVDDDFLDTGEAAYVCSVILVRQGISCAWCSLTDGLFLMSMLSADQGWEALRALFEQIRPREVIVNEDDHIGNAPFAQAVATSKALVTRIPSWQCTVKHGYDILRDHLGTVSLKSFGLEERDAVLASAGALLRYIKNTSMAVVSHLRGFLKADRESEMHIDESTRRNLELVANLEDGSKERSLLWAIDATATAGGSRLLRNWVSSPLHCSERIKARQDQVGWFLDHPDELRRLRTLLQDLPDLIRLATRVSMRRCNVQDLSSIARSIAVFFKVVSQQTDHYRLFFTDEMDDASLNGLVVLMEVLDAAVEQGAMGPFMAGQTIRAGYDEALDELRTAHGNGNGRLLQYLARLKEETGIPTMRLAYNKVVGHYIEVPKTHVAKIPAAFFRKQTLVNAERYTTDELTRLETELSASEDAAARLERTIYDGLVTRCAQAVAVLNAVASFLSAIDCQQGLATVAKTHAYVRPVVAGEGPLVIEGGRHPVVERFLPLGKFVANPLRMTAPHERFCLITGPNMAGKSTYLRQNALIVLLAHIGSYVPADEAVIPLVDKLYCRIGASDNLAKGESTFLVEMQEAAFILRTATADSFVVMDEIGRGTSTQDGMSIAYAVMRDLVERGVRTLFATHYHELTMLDTRDVQLSTLQVAETKNGIVFLRKLVNGAAGNSYGLHVAAMAGMPQRVLKSAAVFQKRHFEDYTFSGNDSQLDLFKNPDRIEEQCAPDGARAAEIVAKLLEYDLEQATPVQAMGFLELLQQAARD